MSNAYFLCSISYLLREMSGVDQYVSILMLECL